MAEVAQRVDDDRAEKILDAVGELVTERGISGLTTALVARRARVAPGKFYEIYADKYDVVRAALDRNLRRFMDRFLAEMPEGSEVSIAELGLVTFDVFVDLCRDDVVFRALRLWTHELPGSDGKDGDVEVTSVWADFLSERYGVEKDKSLLQLLTIGTKFSDELVAYAFQVDPVNGDPDILARTRSLLEFHLSS